MKFNITAGSHPAMVDIDLDGKGEFTGTLTSPEFGEGVISEGEELGGRLKGTVSLNGHSARFEAFLDVPNISGKLSVVKFGMTFFSEHFTGTQIS